MAARPILRDELIHFWQHRGAGLCAEAQADGVPCTALGRACETCAMAVAAWMAANAAAHPLTPNGSGAPECGP